MKTVLILVDGMRPDGLQDIPQVQTMQKNASYTMNAQTVYPSVTLPCHMSLFHSVDPERHGTTDNTYTPQVRPIPGLCEALNWGGKTSAFFYNWEELRDLTRPGSLAYSYYISSKKITMEIANHKVTENAIAYIKENEPDFAFIYLGWVDIAGHDYGWMGEEYVRAVRDSWKNIERIMAELSEDYAVIVTADHGGHDRSHGSRMAEDMTIPVFFQGTPFEAGNVLTDVSIKDIAPTITKILGVHTPEEWEGKSVLS